MSWFKRSPPKNPPPVRPHVQHHRNSAASERAMEEAKALGPSKPKEKSSTT